MSTPITFPESPTSALAMKQSFPAPEPKSNTQSPFLISANSVGIPHPNPKSASGTYPSSFSYFSANIA